MVCYSHHDENRKRTIIWLKPNHNCVRTVNLWTHSPNSHIRGPMPNFRTPHPKVYGCFVGSRTAPALNHSHCYLALWTSYYSIVFIHMYLSPVISSSILRQSFKSCYGRVYCKHTILTSTAVVMLRFRLAPAFTSFLLQFPPCLVGSCGICSVHVSCSHCMLWYFTNSCRCRTINSLTTVFIVFLYMYIYLLLLAVKCFKACIYKTCYGNKHTIWTITPIVL